MLIKTALTKASVLGNLALAYAEIHNLSVAVAYAQQALELYRSINHHEGSAVALYHLARLTENVGRTAEAIALWEELIELENESNPSRAEGYRKRIAGLRQQLP